MNVFLGISRSRLPLSLKVGSESFWCVYRTNKAQKGDLLLLYFTVSGIRQVYRIEDIESAKARYDCQERAMVTVTTRLLANLEMRITVAQLKADSVLRDMGAVRRNFQETVFRVADDHWPHLRDMILESNPQLEPSLLDGESPSLAEHATEG